MQLLPWLRLLTVWLCWGLFEDLVFHALSQPFTISHQLVPTSRYSPGEKLGPPALYRRMVRPHCRQACGMGAVLEAIFEKSKLPVTWSWGGERGLRTPLLPSANIETLSRSWPLGVQTSRSASTKPHTRPLCVCSLRVLLCLLCSLAQVKQAHSFIIYPCYVPDGTISVLLSLKTKMRSKIKWLSLYLLNESWVVPSVFKAVISMPVWLL